MVNTFGITPLSFDTLPRYYVPSLQDSFNGFDHIGKSMVTSNGKVQSTSKIFKYFPWCMRSLVHSWLIYVMALFISGIVLEYCFLEAHLKFL